jgi:hypothetical protein
VQEIEAALITKAHAARAGVVGCVVGCVVAGNALKQQHAAVKADAENGTHLAGPKADARVKANNARLQNAGTLNNTAASHAKRLTTRAKNKEASTPSAKPAEVASFGAFVHISASNLKDRAGKVISKLVFFKKRNEKKRRETKRFSH